MIVYSSRTGNVKFIAKNISDNNVEIEDGMMVNEPFILITYTDLLGEIPKIVSEFMTKNHGQCKGVVGSGNSNFGHRYFCMAAEKISKLYDIPLIKKVELRGFPKDYDEIKLKYKILIEGDN